MLGIYRVFIKYFSESAMMNRFYKKYSKIKEKQKHNFSYFRQMYCFLPAQSGTRLTRTICIAGRRRQDSTSQPTQHCEENEQQPVPALGIVNQILKCNIYRKITMLVFMLTTASSVYLLSTKIVVVSKHKISHLLSNLLFSLQKINVILNFTP